MKSFLSTVSLTIFLAALPAALPAAPFLVKDLNTAPSTEQTPVFLKDLVSGEGVSYFAAGDSAHGVELWRSDGTPGGTERLTDICAGRCDALASDQPAAITVHAGRVFFQANDGFSGDELWVSDGTPGSERRVRDLCPGPCSAAPGRVEEVGDRLLFFAHFPADPDHFELWQTDGTRDGTVQVKALCTAPCSVSTDLNRVGERALFIIATLSGESELWVTDGTADGTRTLRELGSSIIPHSYNPVVAPGGGFAWVWGSDGLWRTDGTAAGTFRLKGIDELTPVPGRDPYLNRPVLWHGLFFGVLDNEAMIRSDGTPEGTFRLAELYATGEFALLDSELLFQASDEVSSTHLWSSRGTADTTSPLDLGFDPAIGFQTSLTGLSGDRALLLWAPYDTPDETQLWVTDGTAAGTRRLTIPVGVQTGGPSLFPTGDGRAFFFGAPPPNDLWITDGTEAGTHRVGSFGDAPGSSGPQEQAALGGRLVFSGLATNRSLPTLFASDGTAAGTRLLSEDAGSAASFFQLGNRLLFSAGKSADAIYDATWVTDGTPEGTARVKNTPFAYPALLGGQILFSGYVSRSGTELWKIDSLTRPIDLLKNIDRFYTDTNAGSSQTCEAESSLPVPGVVVGGRLLLAADDGRSGRELWASDGTRAGTVLLRDINLGRTPGEVPQPCYNGPFAPPRYDMGLSSDPQGFVLLGSVALFTADDGSRGRELWITNGAFLGTHRVADLVPGPRGSAPHDLVRFQNRVYFLAANPGQGESLWSTDGTRRGTIRVLDLTLDGQPSWGRGLTVAAGRLFFTVYNETTGAELWTSAGLLADLNPGPASSSAQSLTTIGGALLFAADDGLTGLEPWRSDGTAAGTVRVSDIAPGRDASSPGPFTPVKNLVMTGADDGVHGRELWAIPRAEIVQPPE